MYLKKLLALALALTLALIGTGVIAYAQSFENTATPSASVEAESTPAPTETETSNIVVEGAAPTAESEALKDDPEEPVDEPEEPVDEPEAPADEPVTPAADPTAAHTVEPKDENAGQPAADESAALYSVRYFGADGNLLESCEIESGKTAEEKAFSSDGGVFLGWYLCDENGAYIADAPYDFSQPVDGALYLRARVSEKTEAAPEPAGETVPKSVVVAASYDTETLRLGSRITLTATLTGYEGLDYTCHWQYAAASSDGSIIGEWQDAQSGDLSFTYVLTEKNLLTAWRMCVTVNE